ncbi:hypothetical protein GSI_01198 [Ganoderma sinense ZZ0214-1]|uniref:Uncharacterized protein n=1 Tax=Ganoderma sinense ZZ0214-1 TaxID=1077348 RepID=A0A2G8SUS3_9APHY|nr:hypothetical protein GSI_01198 [Ganoderma sinense ZZ0214-1]
MDFNAMIQRTTHLEEYAVPAGVLFVFLLLIHQRHRFTLATATNVNGERSGKGVRPPGRIQRAASAAVAEAVVDFDGDETAGSVESEGAIEDPPSPSDSLSSNAGDAVVGYSNGPATRAGSLYSIPEHDAQARDNHRCSPDAPTSRAVLHRDTPAEGCRSLRSGSRSSTAASTALQGPTIRVVSASEVGMASRMPRAPSATSASTGRASSLSVEFLLPKVESDDDDYVLNKTVPISTPLPPKCASTPRTPSKARGGRSFSQDLDNLASDDVAPLSSPLPPKQSSARVSSASTSRNNSINSSSSLSRGSSSVAGRASAGARSCTAMPSSASTSRAISHMSHDATPPPSSFASFASATVSRAQSPDIWGSMSRMSSLSPSPSEVTEQWVRKVSCRTLPSADDAGDRAEHAIITSWFESSSDVSDALIDCPPNLRDHPDLQIGDLFYHSTPTDYQLWIWEVDEDDKLRWVRVKFMSVRNGLYLTLTPEERRPSWVSEKYARARKRQLHRQGYDV